MVQKKRFDRKAQLTMFMLIGMFMVGVFALLWYLNTRVAEQQLQAPTEKIIADLLKTGSIPYYVGVCLEQDAKQGLLFTGQQGGSIFVDEEGPAPNPTRFLPLSYRVLYGISLPNLKNFTLYPFPPGYPGGEKTMKQVPALEFSHEGRFGEVSLTRLCDNLGANSPYAQYALGRGGLSISQVFCQAPYIYSANLSTQWQLEQYIQRKVVNCTNWTAIREETGYNITPTGDPNITFRLGIDDTWVDAFIPLRIEVGGREPIYTIGDFHARVPVRLKRIVELASYLATYDSYRLNFNMSRDYSGYFPSLFDTNIRVTVDTPFRMSGVWDDVITIEDAASVMDGKDYVYRFVRQNRYPALDWIHQMTNWSDYDIVVMENDTIILDPNPPRWKTPSGDEMDVIYDPDEDNLTYYYTGWKETCDEKFDFTLGIPNSACSAQEPTLPSDYFKFPNQGADFDNTIWTDENSWKSMTTYRYSIEAAAINAPSMTVADRYPDGPARNWTSSEAFITTGRNATYAPTHDDIGPHNVTVWVCDEAGLCDYQVVRIMVFDFPMLHLNGTNPYKDIPYDKASVEDFYRLTAEGSVAYYTPLLGYIFSDLTEPFEIKIDHPLQILDLPKVPPDPSYARDIRYIHNFTFNRSALCSTPPCIHVINLSIPEISVPPKHMNVSVYQCLPHLNPQHPLPWPYNDTPDVYLTSHTCCSLGKSFNQTFNVSSDLTGGKATVANGYGLDLDTIQIYKPNGDLLCGPDFSNPCPPLTENPVAIDNYRVSITFALPVSLDDEGIYTVEEFAKDTSVYSAADWGYWLPVTTVCFGGEPKVGAYTVMKDEGDPAGLVTEEDVTNEIISGTTLSYAGSESLPDGWMNDMLISLFSRKCSGNRGNICNGIADKYFRQLRDCKDPVGAEVESCQGPDVEFFTASKPLIVIPGKDPCVNDIDCGNDALCVDSRCYKNPDTVQCANYPLPYSTGTLYTFEQAFKLNKKGLDVLADGICNPTITCSSKATVYKPEEKQGPWLINGATCDGEGKCARPVPDELVANGITNCADAYNGLKSKDADRSLPSSYACYLGQDKHLQSNNYSCNEIGSIDCKPDKRDNPDSHPGLCDACLKAQPFI